MKQRDRRRRYSRIYLYSWVFVISSQVLLLGKGIEIAIGLMGNIR